MVIDPQIEKIVEIANESNDCYDTIVSNAWMIVLKKFSEDSPIVLIKSVIHIDCSA